MRHGKFPPLIIVVSVCLGKVVPENILVLEKVFSFSVGSAVPSSLLKNQCQRLWCWDQCYRFCLKILGHLVCVQHLQ